MCDIHYRHTGLIFPAAGQQPITGQVLQDLFELDWIVTGGAQGCDGLLPPGIGAPFHQNESGAGKRDGQGLTEWGTTWPESHRPLRP